MLREGAASLAGGLWHHACGGGGGSGSGGGGGAPAGSEESPSLLYSATPVYSSSHASQNHSPQDILMFHTERGELEKK